MGQRKWFPVSEEHTVETSRYRYVVGLYDHEQYGRNCVRVSKFIRENGYFIGHFVIVPEDLAPVRNALTAAMDQAQRAETQPEEVIA
jgi:hypothetical protein